MAPRTVSVSRAELLARRQRVLARVGMTAEEFRKRVEAGALTPSDWDDAEDLEEVSFLLGEKVDEH